MARLNGQHKAFIVASLACFETPEEVAASVKDVFGIEIPRQQVYHYDPYRPGGPEKWKALFDDTREKFLARVTDIPIANQAVRLKRLEDAYNRARRMGRSGNIPLETAALKQAAEETGGKYTNHHVMEHSGKVDTGGVLLVPASAAALGEWMSSAMDAQDDLALQAAEAAKGWVDDDGPAGEP